MYCYKQKSIEEITTFLAHEVKNPVALIKANIELLELDKSFTSYEKNITLIKKELNKITDIVSDFMFLFNSSDQNNLDKINILTNLSQIVDDFALTNPNIKFYLNSYCSEQDTVIFTQENKINILFLNIIKNAVESIEYSGEIKIEIYKTHKGLTIDIIDNGQGIKEGLKKYIGRPFFTSKPNGSGLGLCICNKIINELNGKFELFNSKKRGCTARIIF